MHFPKVQFYAAGDFQKMKQAIACCWLRGHGNWCLLGMNIVINIFRWIFKFWPFFSFIFQCAQGTAFGLRLTLVDVVEDDEVLNYLVDVVGAQLSVTKCLKFDLLVWNQILCCSQAEAVGLRLTLSTLGRPSSGLICHHHFITNQSLMYTHGSKCVFCTRLKLAGICHHHFISSTSSVHTLSSLQRFCRSAN